MNADGPLVRPPVWARANVGSAYICVIPSYPRASAFPLSCPPGGTHAPGWRRNARPRNGAAKQPWSTSVAVLAHSSFNAQFHDSISFREARTEHHHANKHGAPRIKRQILKSPSSIEPAHAIIQRMRDNSQPNGFRSNQCSSQREQQRRRRDTLTLKRLVHRKLAEQRGRHRIMAVALLRPGRKCALDLCCAQSDIAGDPPGPHFGDDVHTRNAAALIGPGLPAGPRVQRVPATVELTSVVCLGQWARRSDKRDGSAFPGRLTVGDLNEPGQFLGRSSDPGLERRPVLCRNADDHPVEHLGFSRFQRLAANELAEAGVGLLFKRSGRVVVADSAAFVRSSPQARGQIIRRGRSRREAAPWHRRLC